ncbi:MAG: carbonic anhydrase, partial [Hyphomicrobiaceae bacterium]
MIRNLEHLLDQNVAWADQKIADDPSFFRRMVEQQSPHYLWIGCSDSRVTANDVLGLDPGEVFVHRNIANIVHTSDLNILSVLELAIDHLRVEHIIVCGHYGCSGNLRALAIERGTMIDHWLQPITMLYRKHRPAFDAV